MNPHEEIKQRLEVAQLYEEMNQLPKAARYYINAAEIALKSKLFDRGRELLEHALKLEPGNAKATDYLQRLEAHLASLGQPSKPFEKPAASPEATRPSGGVTIPTPALYLRSEQISAILAQVSSAPNAKFFPFTPLPPIDEKAIEEKQKQLEAVREAERAKERTAVESAFSDQKTSFKGGGFLKQVQRGGRRRDREESAEEAAPPAEGRRRRRSGANESLADSIRKRLQGG